LQLLDMTAGSRLPDRACIISDRMDELLIKQNTVFNGQASSHI